MILIPQNGLTKLFPGQRIALIFLAPPGSGKTEQAQILQNKYCCVVISLERIITLAVGASTEPGRRFVALSRAGKSLPAELFWEMVNDRLCAALAMDMSGPLVFEDFPKTRAQAELLLPFFKEHDYRVFLVHITDMPLEVCEARTSRNGQVCNLEHLKKRYVQFERNASEVRGYLCRHLEIGEISVSGLGQPHFISAEIVRQLACLASLRPDRNY